MFKVKHFCYVACINPKSLKPYQFVLFLGDPQSCCGSRVLKVMESSGAEAFIFCVHFSFFVLENALGKRSRNGLIFNGISIVFEMCNQVKHNYKYFSQNFFTFAGRDRNAIHTY